MSSEPPQADETRTGRPADCPLCGKPAGCVEDSVLEERTWVYRCSCFGGEIRCDAVPAPPQPEPCSDCGCQSTPVFLRGPFGTTGIWCLRWACECQGKRDRSHLERARQAREEEDARSRLRDAAIPPKYAASSLENFTVYPEFADGCARIATWCREVTDRVSDGRGLLLIGPTGTGKTHLATAALRAALDAGHSGLWRDVRQHLRLLRASYSAPRGVEGRDPFREAVEPRVFLLDDLGSARLDRNPEHVREAILDIVSERDLRVLTTIATANRSLQELREDLDERITSRLEQNCELVVLDGPDYRTRNGPGG